MKYLRFPNEIKTDISPSEKKPHLFYFVTSLQKKPTYI
jgi:hypothetical protein